MVENVVTDQDPGSQLTAAANNAETYGIGIMIQILWVW
jgi:hypothetical protein